MNPVEQELSEEFARRLEQRAKVRAFISNELQVAHSVLSENAEQAHAIEEFESRPYQEDAWDALWQAREEGAEKGLIRLATGLGKTPVAIFDYAKFRTEQIALGNSPRGLFVVHQNNILSQASERFGRVLPNATRSRLSNRVSGLPGSELTFATFQTLRKSVQKFPPNFFDYIIYDEAHHIEADTFKKVVDYFQPQFQLGLTATPNRKDRRDITEHFGEPLYSKTLPEAIGEGYLANVSYSVMSDDAIKRALRDGFQPRNTAEIRALFDVEPRNDRIVAKIKSAQEKIKADEGIDFVKTIVFCEDIDVTEEYAELLSGKSYHSKLKDQEQEQVFRGFVDGEFETITVRDMLNEGVNVPDARLVVFLRTTQSKMIFEQQLGRGLRKLEGKDTVTVLDFVANIDRLIMLEELAGIVFNQDTKEGFDDPEAEESELVLGDEHNRFIFDQDVINLLHAYNQLVEQEGRAKWNKHTNEEIIELALKISPDKPMDYNDIVSLPRNEFPSMDLVRKRFGRLSNFQRACGFEVIDWENVTNYEIIQRALEISPDEPLKHSDMKKLDKSTLPSPGMIVQRFGSWVKFQQECGFNVVDWGSVSNEEIVRLALQLSPNAPMTAAMIRGLDNTVFPGYSTITQRFEGYVAFIKACGFDVENTWRYYDNQAIIDLALKISPNRPLSNKDIQDLTTKEFPSTTMIGGRFGSVIEFQKACGFSVRPRWKDLSDEQLIEIARALNPNSPMTKKLIDSYESTDFPSSSYISNRFGSIEDFNKLAGYRLERSWNRATTQEIIEAAKLISPNAPLTTGLINALPRNDFPNLNTICEKFGSLKKFQQECGFDIKEGKDWSTYDDDYFVQFAQKISPHAPLSREAIDALSRDEFPNSETIARRFGSIAKFYLACGFEYREPVDWRKWSNDEIVQLALSLSPNRPLTKREIEAYAVEKEFPSNKIVLNRFGSIAALSRACGFEALENRDWSAYSNEDIIKLALELSPNEPLSAESIAKLSRERKFPGLNFLSSRFNKVTSFQKACGFDVYERIKWSDLSKEDIVRLALELSPDRALSHHMMRNLSKVARFPNPNFISELFGSTGEFQKACGFEPLRSK